VQDRVTAPIAANNAADAEADAVAEWIASPEGQKALRDTLDKVDRAIAKLEETSRISPESLRRPMTI
jgi:hypothetical protein